MFTQAPVLGQNLLYLKQLKSLLLEEAAMALTVLRVVKVLAAMGQVEQVALQ
jgi:hypothetical protein